MSLWFLLLACNRNEPGDSDTDVPEVIDTDVIPEDTDLPEDTEETEETEEPEDTEDTEEPEDTDLPVEPADDLELLPDPPLLSSTAIGDLVDDIENVIGDTNHGVYIIDAENGQIVYESNADTRLKPASNTKLFTTAGSFARFGEDYRHVIELWAPAAPSSGNVASMTAWCGHDPTWSSNVANDAYYAADRLADLAYAAGVRKITGTLTIAGEVLVNGNSVGYYDPATHRARAAVVLRDAFVARGIPVGGTATTDDLDTPAGVKIAERPTIPLSVVHMAINTPSHNEMADIHLRHIGFELGSGSSYSAGAIELLEGLSDLGVDTSDLAFYDGSGLSHSNRVTARAVVELIEKMAEHPSGVDWERGMAIAGVRGTIASRMTGADVIGRFYGKTGTLSDTIALSGILHHKHDGHRYYISILQNSVYSQSTARSLADQVVGLVAKDWRPGTGRPARPELVAMTAKSGVATLSWNAVSGASAYGVWTSTDGRVWDRAMAYTTTATTVRLDAPNGLPLYARVIAVNDGGWSEPSDTYGVEGGGAKRVLIVDANQRWDTQAENTLGAGHDFVRVLGEAIETPGFDSAGVGAVVDGKVSLDDYDAVVWALGEESTANKTFDAPERAIVEDWLATGGALVVSGAEVAWDLDNKGTTETRDFYSDWLHASFASDDGASWGVGPAAGGIFEGLGEIGIYTPTGMIIEYPDELNAENGAEDALEYLEGNPGSAAVTYDGDYAVVTLGFPIEAIDGTDRRAEVLARIFSFFGM